MKCQEFEPVIISLARGQLVEASARETALAHLERCARCAIAFEEQQSLTAGIRVAVESLSRQDASERVEEALRRAFREQAGREQTGRLITTKINSQTKWDWRWSWSLVGAAVVIILLALLSGMDWLKSPPANQRREANNLPATPPITAPEQKQESQAQTGGREIRNQKAPSNPAASRRHGRRYGVRQNAEIANDVATRFYPLVEEDEMAPLESGRIVRVEMPASALISLGLSIPAESVNRPVQADLLLGQDGLARAIRFLP